MKNFESSHAQCTTGSEALNEIAYILSQANPGLALETLIKDGEINKGLLSGIANLKPRSSPFEVKIRVNPKLDSDQSKVRSRSI